MTNEDRLSVTPVETEAAPRPTDFLAFSRQYASEMALDEDITTWDPQDFQAFLDWWLLRTMRHVVDEEVG